MVPKYWELRWRFRQDSQSKHVLAGDILAKKNTPLLQQTICQFIDALPDNNSMPLLPMRVAKQQERKSPAQRYDLVVVGGGVNGLAVALQAKLQGWSVFLLENKDLAYGTSNASSKLIHGGLRYLQQGQIAMVKKALKERQQLFDIAPFLIRPVSMLLPVQSVWQQLKVQLGLWIYDRLANAPKAQQYSMMILPKDSILKSQYKRALQFIDGQTDDARLVMQLAKTAVDMGVHIRTRSDIAAIEFNEPNKTWQLQVVASEQANYLVQASTIVNCTGPFAQQWFQQHMLVYFPNVIQRQLRLLKGSHILVKSFTDRAYLLPLPNARVLFVLPFAGLTMIGTTEQPTTLQQPVRMQAEELLYLLDKVNEFLHQSLSEADVLHSFSGIRPLVENSASDHSHLSRDYVIEHLNIQDAHLINVYGGKITTFRSLAHDVLTLLHQQHKMAVPKLIERIHGGALSLSVLFIRLKRIAPFLSDQQVTRLIESYGETVFAWFSQKKESQLGQRFADGIYQVEIDYLLEKEWVCSADDILLRRSRFSWQLTQQQQASIRQYVEQQLATF